jgi:uncharacterized protein YycO
MKLNLPALHCGDIVNFRSRGFFSKIIRFGTGGDTNHSAIYVGGGRQYLIEALGKGVKKTRLPSRVKKKDTERVVVLRYEKLTVNEAEIIKDYAYSRIGVKYDWRQIVGFGIWCFGRIFLGKKFWEKHKCNPFDTKEKDICSELVYNAYQKAGIKLCPEKNESNVTPADLERSLLLKKIAELRKQKN